MGIDRITFACVCLHVWVGALKTTAAIIQEYLGWLPSTKKGRNGSALAIIYLVYLLRHRHNSQKAQKLCFMLL